jgi:hypothetical protein
LGFLAVVLIRRRAARYALVLISVFVRHTAVVVRPHPERAVIVTKLQAKLASEVIFDEKVLVVVTLVGVSLAKVTRVSLRAEAIRVSIFGYFEKQARDEYGLHPFDV